MPLDQREQVTSTSPAPVVLGTFVVDGKPVGPPVPMRVVERSFTPLSPEPEHIRGSYSFGVDFAAGGELVHGFRLSTIESLPGGGTVTSWTNEEARYLVIVDELRIQAGAGIPRGALVFLEPGIGSTQEQVDAAERNAVELGAVAVRKLPAREQGTGAAPAAAPAGQDLTLREAVDQALAKLPPDVRAGAARRADGFLSAEKV